MERTKGVIKTDWGVVGGGWVVGNRKDGDEYPGGAKKGNLMK